MGAAAVEDMDERIEQLCDLRVGGVVTTPACVVVPLKAGTRRVRSLE